MRPIDADALKLALRKTMDACVDEDGTLLCSDHLIIDADYDEVCNVIDEQPTIQSEHRWIPVSENLPDNEEKAYWVCTSDGWQGTCRWTDVNHFWTQLKSDWHWHYFDLPQYSGDVVAWRELPQPYKGKEQ